MKRWKQLVMAFAMVVSFGTVMLPSPNVAAINVFKGCDGNAGSDVCKAKNADDASDLIKIVINTLLLILGMIAVVMIVIGGIRYTTSNGDSSQVKGAKDTIMYAIIGLVVAIMSFTIVNFVLGRF